MHDCTVYNQRSASVCLGRMVRRTQVMKVVFGQDLADESAGVAQQVFSVSVAIGGLAAFALVLALIEQVVLQVRGPPDCALTRDGHVQGLLFRHWLVYVICTGSFDLSRKVSAANTHVTNTDRLSVLADC